MKNLFSITLLTIMLMSFATAPISAKEEPGAKTVLLKKQHDPKDDPHYEFDDTGEGRRMPQRPLQCVITQEGIYIAGIDSAEIYMYEVCDETGECMASFVTEQEFIGYVFQVSGTVEIRLYIDGYILHGFLHP